MCLTQPAPTSPLRQVVAGFIPAWGLGGHKALPYNLCPLSRDGESGGVYPRLGGDREGTRPSPTTSRLQSGRKTFIIFHCPGSKSGRTGQ